MRWIRFVLLVLVLTLAGTAHASGSNGRACGGRTVSGVDACCISGKVIVDGKPVAGALVVAEVERDGKLVRISDTTSYVEGDAEPTYGFTLHEDPLYAQPGDVLKITVFYGKLTRIVEHKVQADEQWLDIELFTSPATAVGS